jgi:hypothetical protein
MTGLSQAETAPAWQSGEQTRQVSSALVWAGIVAMLGPLTSFALALFPLTMLRPDTFPLSALWLGISTAVIQFTLVALFDWARPEPAHHPSSQRIAFVGWSLGGVALAVGLISYLVSGRPSFPLLIPHCLLLPAGWRFGNWLMERSRMFD